MSTSASGRRRLAGSLLALAGAAAVTACGSAPSASHTVSRQTTYSSRAGTGAAETLTPAKARYIAEADAVCRRTSNSLTPVQNRLYADENRVDASIGADTLSNRRRVADDWKQAVTVDRRKLAALRALPAPVAGRAAIDRYLSAFQTQISLIGQLIQAYEIPSGAPVSNQHLTALAAQLAVARRIETAQMDGIAAAHAFGFHVCGAGR